VEIEVVNKGKSGILGIGGTLATVKVTKISDISDEITIASQAVNKLILLMGVEVVINVKHSDSAADSGSFFEIEGEDSGLLIGRKGETLRSLQFLAGLLLNNKTEHRSRLFIDVEGYEDRHNQSLIHLAKRVAMRVEKTGRNIELEPMNPKERRIVHMALADIQGVETESSGSGVDRKVVISPVQ